MKLPVIFFIFSVAIPQIFCATCEYSFTAELGYSCLISDLQVVNENDVVNINGQHSVGFSDEDVNTVVVFGGQASYIPAVIFEKFGKIMNLAFLATELKAIKASNFFNCNQLLQVAFDFNELESIPASVFAACPSIIAASFAENKISTIDDAAFRGLNILMGLSLDTNKLTTIRPEMLKEIPALILLELANNEITELGENLFKDNSILLGLDANYNKIKTLNPGTFKLIPNLEALTVGGNEISELDKNLFASNINVVGIELGFNKLKKIDSETFKPMASVLEILLLAENEIDAIDPELFNILKKLRWFNFEDNKCANYSYVHETRPVVFSEVLETFSKCIDNYKNSSISLRSNDLLKIAALLVIALMKFF